MSSGVRRRLVRASSVRMDRVSIRRIADEWKRVPPPVETRPQTRGECVDGPRPCPWVSCRHHLYLDVSERTGSLKLNFPDLDPLQLVETCSLDVADRGGMSVDDIAGCINLGRQQVRNIEAAALVRISRTLRAAR